MTFRAAILLSLCVAVLPAAVRGELARSMNGTELMEAVYERHEQFPYVYEEQSMILIDQRGNNNTRKLRRYSRVNEDGGADFLLLFDSPLDVRGVALIAHRDKTGRAKQSFYLPAFGGDFLESEADHDGQSEDHFLGTDFSIENLVGEMLDQHRHLRREDEILNDTDFYVVDTFKAGDESLVPLRRHYIRKDNLFVTRTDHFDELGRLKKRQTHHDLVNVHGEMWRANMMMMDNFQQEHRTIIKIDRRVFSADYVPKEVFTKKWILTNQAPLADEELEHVYRVDSLFNLRIIEGVTGSDGQPVISTELVIDDVPTDDISAADARLRALANPLYIGNLFSEDGNVTAIIVTVNDINDQEDFSLEVYRQFQRLIDNEGNHFERIFQVGPPRINAELKQSLASDFKLLGPLSAIVLVASILFFMRSALAAVIPLITSVLAILWTFGLMGWLGIPLNILSAMIPSLIIVIGSTEDTHMMAAFFRGLAEQSSNGIVTILVVPPLLAKFGKKMGQGKTAEELYGNNLPDQIIRTFRISQDRFPVMVLVLTGLLCLFFTYQASHLYVTNDPLSYFPEDRELIQETKTIHEDLAGIKVFFVTLEADNANAFLGVENLQKLNKIQAFINKQNVFDSTLSIADHLKYVNKEFQGEFAADTLPQSRQLVAQYLMFFHRSELESYVSHDYRQANIIVRHNITDSHTLNQYVDELKQFVGHISGDGIRARVVGENLLVNQAAESLMVSQIQALTLLLLLIFVLMSIMFTSLKGGAIAMIPSVIPIVLMFGIMGLLGIPLNPGTAMVAVIAVGIAIDGTIHLLAHYNELCRTTSDYDGAVHQAVQEVATPLIVSSLALSLGFGILLFSNFTVVAQFGALAAATMLISIFANLLITPIIMTRIRLVGLYQIIAMKVDQQVLEESPLFSNMTNYERRKAILISEIHEFSTGEKLVTQGDIGRNMYMILSGSARVERRDGEGTRLLAELTPGQVFGEVGYIRAIERTADVVAATPVTALNFEYHRMQKDLKFFPNIVAKLNFNISGILGERLADVLDSR
ncbi:MAG: MMPL family transporter [Pseudomonadales bacterium]|nr:MMPL family transporter [Pseudomonadales bacterium]